MTNPFSKICALSLVLLLTVAPVSLHAQTENSEPAGEATKKPEPPKVTTQYDDIKGITTLYGPTIEVIKKTKPVISGGGAVFGVQLNLDSKYEFLGEKPQRPEVIKLRYWAVVLKIVTSTMSITTDNKMDCVKSVFIKYGDKRAEFPLVYSRQMLGDEYVGEELVASIPTEDFVNIARSPSLRFQYETGALDGVTKGEVTPDQMFALHMIADEIAKAEK